MVFTKPCEACGGDGHIQSESCRSCQGVGVAPRTEVLTVPVPPGVESGARISVPGHGHAGAHGGPAGDLYVEVHERPHAVFTRDGEDLHCRVTLPMTAAALGTMLKLETLEGHEDLTIKPGTQSGNVITLRAHGAPRLRGTGRGNLMVHLDVQTPTRLDERQQELLRELAGLRGEDLTEGTGANTGGLFSRVRDAFNGR